MKKLFILLFVCTMYIATNAQYIAVYQGTNTVICDGHNPFLADNCKTDYVNYTTVSVDEWSRLVTITGYAFTTPISISLNHTGFDGWNKVYSGYDRNNGLAASLTHYVNDHRITITYHQGTIKKIANVRNILQLQ